MIKGLIFDFDGLILDTETPELQALNEAYGDYGQSLAVETYGQVVGAQYNQQYEPIAHLQSLIGRPVDEQAFWARVNQRRLEIITNSPLLPGVENYLREAKARGLKLAVASSSPHAWVDGHLQRLGLFHYFDTILCKDDVRQIKPHPELFLTTLSALQLPAEAALIFEDSANGVSAARQAGIRVILVPNPVTVKLKIEGESLRLKSLAELPLADLLARF
jgi:putative hydrolase of the HAD superfamily